MPLWPMNEDDLEAMEIERLDQQRPEEEQQFERELLEQQDIEGELEDQDILAQLHQESLAADPKYLLYLKARQEEYDQFEAEQEAAEQVFRTGIPSVPYKPIPLVDSTLVAPQPQGFASNKDSKGLAPQQQTADPQQGAEKKVPPKSRKPHNKADDKITPYDVAQKLISHEHFVAIKEDLYWFSGRVYWRLSKTDTLRLIVERCRVVVKEVGNANFVEQVYKCLLQEPSICNSDLLPSPDEVVFLDGVLNLKTRAFFPHTPKVFATSFLTANYEQGKRASCPRFDTFVTEIANGDPLLAQRIWEALGYLLTQDHRGKTFILLQGPTETGKSVFGNFVRSCINKEAVSALDLHSFGGRFDLADLIGKQLCIDMDLSSRRIDERTGSNLKKMTGGDELSTDVKFKDRENFTNTAKILFSTNHYFSFADDDGGAKLRRTTVIPFTRTIPQSEQNFDLVAYLEEEKDAVVVKALYNYCNLRDRNYIFPGDYAVNDAIGGEDLSDCVAQFLIENCVEADVWTSTSEFFEEFCRQFGAMCAMNTFSEILHLIVKDTYPSVKKKRGRINGQGNPVGGYLGLALKTEDSSTASTT